MNGLFTLVTRPLSYMTSMETVISGQNRYRWADGWYACRILNRTNWVACIALFGLFGTLPFSNSFYDEVNGPGLGSLELEYWP